MVIHVASLAKKQDTHWGVRVPIYNIYDDDNDDNDDNDITIFGSPVIGRSKTCCFVMDLSISCSNSRFSLEPRWGQVGIKLGI